MARLSGRQVKGAPPLSSAGYLIKEAFAACGITQREVAQSIRMPRGGKCSYTTLNHAINGLGWPTSGAQLRVDIEAFVSGNQCVSRWLKDNRYTINDIWSPLGERRFAEVAGRGTRISKSKLTRPVVPGDPNEIEKAYEEAMMLSFEAKRRFKIFGDPFMNDVRQSSDIFTGEEQEFLTAAMIDAARNAGFVAIIGEVGCGKSVMRKAVVMKLAADPNIRIAYPRIIDKARVTAGSLSEAIVRDLSSEPPRTSHEARSRQVERLLLDRAAHGGRTCMIIEEAHDLNVHALKLLKRFNEYEYQYAKTLGVILIGQPELGELLDEGVHPEIREVIRRCQVARIRGLNGEVGAYLDHKLKRCKVEMKNIFTSDAITAIGQRLSIQGERNKRISTAYPLSVNILVIKAMNHAAEVGEKLVTAEIIERV